MAAHRRRAQSLPRSLHLSGRPISRREYLTDVAAQYKDFTLATREVVQWKSKDGATIEGILIKPADYDPTRKYPLLVVIHGGPTGVDSPCCPPTATTRSSASPPRAR